MPHSISNANSEPSRRVYVLLAWMASVSVSMMPSCFSDRMPRPFTSPRCRAPRLALARSCSTRTAAAAGDAPGRAPRLERRNQRRNAVRHRLLHDLRGRGQALDDFATMGFTRGSSAVEVPRQRAHQDDHAAAHVVVGGTSRPPRRGTSERCSADHPSAPCRAGRRSRCPPPGFWFCTLSLRSPSPVAP